MSVFYLCPGDRGSRLGSVLERAGLRVSRIDATDDPDRILEAIVGQGRPAVICQRYAPGAAAGFEVSRLLHVPFVLEVPRAPRPPEDPSAALLRRRLFRDSDLVLVASERARRLVAADRGTAAGIVRLRDAGRRLVELKNVSADAVPPP